MYVIVLAGMVLPIEVFLLTVRLFYVQWGNRKQKRPNLISRQGGTVSRKAEKTKPISLKDQTKFQPQVKKTKPNDRKQQ